MRTVELVEATCCPRVEEPTLKVNKDDPKEHCPKFIPWACSHNQYTPLKREKGKPIKYLATPLCDKCKPDSIRFGEKLLSLSKCPTFQNYYGKIDVNMWTEENRKDANPQTGKKEMTQLELTAKEKPFDEVLELFLAALKLSRPHVAELEWMRRVMKIDIETLSENRIWIGTDFSATLDLRSIKTENCSTAGHAVLDIFVVLSNRRWTLVDDGNGGWVHQLMFDTDV